MDIHNTELFKGVSCEECNKMLHCFKSEFREYSAGAHICDYSETEKYIGIITKGSVKIIRTDENGNNSILEHLGENGIFGKYIAYATGAGDGIYVECETPCEVVYIGSEHITKRCSNACECHSRVVENMFDIVTKKSVELSRHLYVLEINFLAIFDLCVSKTKTLSSNFHFPQQHLRSIFVLTEAL